MRVGRSRLVWRPAWLLPVLLCVTPAAGQVASGRDCQTLLTCNYVKGGSFRGCVSSYSCKTCRFVTAKCTVRGETTCRRMRCGWG